MFNKKNDPLVDAVKKVMEQSEKERKAVAEVNNKFGVFSRNALPHEKLAEYDSALKKTLSEDVEVIEEADLDEERKRTSKSYLFTHRGTPEDDAKEKEAKSTKGPGERVVRKFRLGKNNPNGNSGGKKNYAKGSTYPTGNNHQSIKKAHASHYDVYKYDKDPSSKYINMKEEEQINEISSNLAKKYLAKKRERDYETSADGKSFKRKEPQSIEAAAKDKKNTVRALKRAAKDKK